MASLFVIGNGFDMAHQLPTSYQNFREYLISEFPNASPEKGGLAPWSSTMPDGSERYDTDEVVSTIMKLLDEAEGEKWSDIEHSIGCLEYGDFLEGFDSDDEDADEWDNTYNNEDVANNLSGVVQMITKFFDDWILTINVCLGACKPDFVNLINCSQDFFITFNYTLTLEYLYRVSKICHIHGKQGKKLYFGHGNNDDYYDEYMNSYTGSENALSDLQHSLIKNTKEALEINIEFFDGLSNINKIYSYGFSFADVDLVYIKELCKRMDTKGVVWLLNDFDNDKTRATHIEKIVRCGFKGNFGTYHIS